MTFDPRTDGEARRSEYVARVNRAIDYIERHIDREITLEELAKAACFSPYHFHRIFGAVVGETVSRFVQRTRVERAASLLVQHPRRPVTQIALDCGFSSPAVFARTFKQAFGMSATAWRTGEHCATNVGTACKPLGDLDAYGILTFAIEAGTGDPTWTIRCPEQESAKVRVQSLDPWRVAYVRHTGPYQGMAEVFERLFTRLMTWAGPRGLITGDARVLSVYHDDPNITDDEKLRVSACLTIPETAVVEGEIGAMRMAGGPYALGRFVLGDRDYARAWHAMMGGWLPESGYEPDDRPCFELYHDDGTNHPEGKCTVDICIPVRPMDG